MLPFLVFFIFSASSSAFAKTLNLYDQPDPKGKVVAAVDSTSGIVTIFSPKNSEWTKVGDPSNGNVGWIKNSDLENIKMSFNIMRSGNNHQNFQVIQWDSNQLPQQFSDQFQKNIQQMQLQQQAVQKDMQKIMQDMFKNIDQQWANFPIIMPVVIVKERPTQETSPKENKTVKLSESK
jgi:hypothetical protein